MRENSSEVGAEAFVQRGNALGFDSLHYAVQTGFVERAAILVIHARHDHVHCWKFRVSMNECRGSTRDNLLGFMAMQTTKPLQVEESK